MWNNFPSVINNRLVEFKGISLTSALKWQRYAHFQNKFFIALGWCCLFRIFCVICFKWAIGHSLCYHRSSKGFLRLSVELQCFVWISVRTRMTLLTLQRHWRHTSARLCFILCSIILLVPSHSWVSDDHYTPPKHSWKIYVGLLIGACFLATALLLSLSVIRC